MAITTRLNPPHTGNRWTPWASFFLAMLLALLVCGAPNPRAADDLPQIATLNSVPEVEPLPEFHVLGPIDEIRPEGVIVDDSYIEFPGPYETEYFRVSDRSKMTLSGFQVGDYVGCELDAIGKLKTMWKYSQPPE